ncbi:MAG: hypothetical protein CMB80_10115 [Flammeovirgaceae bacterium]|nr:hypothetical protein [Flammeovirgaceae bacterium]MBE61114.1 hypothetical protein [Flammeovirgaceae bacterium]MBR08268.1 hypothetical protein [Rickettsiales bacterium]HCX21840.1 hypothetical protein [Cytophagales bacterium]
MDGSFMLLIPAYPLHRSYPEVPRDQPTVSSTLKAISRLFSKTMTVNLTKDHCDHFLMVPFAE